MKVVIIGTGNVATVLGILLKRAGHDMLQVFGRREAVASQLASQLACSHTSAWDQVSQQADLYLVAIADKALYDLDLHLHVNDRLIVHTAGSVPKTVLTHISTHFGVLYPLQSLRREMPVLTEIPLLVDANNQQSLQQVLQLAQGISAMVSEANDEQRLKLHLTAVVVNNFVNHLYALTADFCKRENISFNLLLPLMAETTKRMEWEAPGNVVTGPAIRNDQVTIAKHLQLLQTYPALLAQYTQLTESIRQSGEG